MSIEFKSNEKLVETLFYEEYNLFVNIHGVMFDYIERYFDEYSVHYGSEEFLRSQMDRSVTDYINKILVVKDILVLQSINFNDDFKNSSGAEKIELINSILPSCERLPSDRELDYINFMLYCRRVKEEFGKIYNGEVYA